LYGGVDFGIDRFRLSAPSRVASSVVAGRATLGRPASSLMAASAAGFSVGPSRQFTRLAGPLGAMSMAAPSRLAGPLTGMSMPPALRSAIAPQGVDLNLDKFNLSAPTHLCSHAAGGEGSLSNVAIGQAFWSDLDCSEKGKPLLSTEDRNLFRAVFNPHLSDRRAEGDCFVPPATDSAYIQGLRRLVQEEESLRQRRKDHFCSTRFDTEDAGPLFPSSWTPSCHGSMAGSLPEVDSLVARHEYKGQTEVLRKAVKSASPAFDRCTEDGMRFRVYKLGSRQVRTMAELDGEESVGAVFSIRPSRTCLAVARSVGHLTEHDKVVKVTEYVMRGSSATIARRSYVVLETESGHAIVTEKLGDGSVTWEEMTGDLELRNSLAKVVRSAVCSGKGNGATAGEMMVLRAEQGRSGHAGAASRSQRKRYAQLAFCRAMGEALGVSVSGFLPRSGLGQSRARCPQRRHWA